VRTLAAGQGGYCATLKSGGVSCWGNNNEGALGTGTEESSPVPVAVKGVSGVRAIASAGEGYCAVTKGGVECWGNNVGGLLGNGGSEAFSAAPVTVKDLK
jgi:alpha-tubulin suppressor-like RCC1 family protein